ncbi:transcription-repair coupling factor [candidate division WOR-1 bacterium RIFOXYA12_FULL_52_29]|uniref:Transcription-repair-coupling factor n=1 Tax=candidate division WOR-1 bacterium RIFOXYC12_FULL_54_18 TaxID=1802584 RepID=A0A1F4T635_UNCSA|nr:MAG: transcription-repair coupling factor [candidate division WOR-1 bacterium RIFOXYA2_FULL_51_19]OGC17815.1 MAG: transcription-repair coupling factor [candidate division WOR-1 bacterium RIFOXYA12_FULL_52_29]OGC26672.1 MAG: transcription-repair coupling factor [candidate division WOR-1 bacterium RIFOXYB2_FULL_45_9]OGC28232.1 MAG: transcription-repair coupling factor [candidate division WOR-1 bacterium RIFOXYC12_FULL_54_18]OGC29480.1 MAG: transcription-repair coupling factor [candidate divisi
MLDKVLAAIAGSDLFRRSVARLKKNEKVSLTDLPGGAFAAVSAALAKDFPVVLVVASTVEKAEGLCQEIDLFIGGRTLHFPPPELFGADNFSETAGERLGILNELSRRNLIVVASARAATSNCQPPKSLHPLEVTVGGEIERDGLLKKLVDFGYRRFDIVGERGEFSVRGGIVDVYPVNLERAVRLEFSGDTVESIRYFDPYSQRSTEKLAAVSVLPARESASIPFFKALPSGSLIVLAEKAEASFKELGEAARVELSSFALPGEEGLCQPADSYLDRLALVPGEALLVSRHPHRLREELAGRAIIEGKLSGGFVINGLTVLSDKELFGEHQLARKKPAAAREGVADELLSDLKYGDFVVHENYGIGIYRGMKNMELGGATQEYLLIEFKNADLLYVPPTMIGLVEKYSGGGEAKPRLSRLGSNEWVKTRGRVKKALRDMTRELTVLYAAREKFPGASFPPDDVWQKELEATFPYEETIDQAKAIAAVKKDMEASRPMDRLVCGDVGYGKTEVAIRAAAKAASAGKQVAILAPTTILVEQHFNNFKERFKNLPFVIEMLSRFRSLRDQKAVARGLEFGGVDIVIGTHRLLSKDIKFRDLGLLIVDEEQRFGVAHKEKLKQLKKSVDVLTLSATPIPRTLYFSLAGLREISLITTPPVDRSPIRTYILPYSDDVLREAVVREIDRGGQVYFVHNTIDKIVGLAARLKKLVPSARVAVGHGQMDAKKLEKTMQEFMERKYDVLVCTSIIESGLDITNVNTIVIDNADRFGLSQLYQIRGRVGRSPVRAYAYLFYHPERGLSELALERLKAIQDFTALGSGYKLAMRDLEIRGSGNLLGAEQSGHIYEVGFDLYCELLEEAVREAKGEKVSPPREVEIDLKVEASIPPEYVTDDRQRVALYRRLNMISSLDGVEEIKGEFKDRFGPIPAPLETLLRIMRLKVKALNNEVKSVKEAGNLIKVEWQSGKAKLFKITGKDIISLAEKALTVGN